MKKYNFVVVGCGAIATKHILEIQRLGVLKAVCDTNLQRLSEFVERYEVKGFDSFSQMLRDTPEIDIVVVCSPNGMHPVHSIEALAAGYHVICEKPMALYTMDALEMMEMAKKKNRFLTIVKQNRYNDTIQQLKEWIHAGHAGKIFSFSLNCLWNRNDQYYLQSDWRGTLDQDGGVLFTQFSHYIDLIYWLFGEVKNIYSITQNAHHQKLLPFADQGVVLFEFENNILGTMHFSINTYDKNMDASITVIAENGNVRIGGTSCDRFESVHTRVPFFKHRNSPQHTLNEYGTYTGSVSNHHKVYDQFVNTLLGGEYDYQSTYEALKTVELIERIYAAA